MKKTLLKILGMFLAIVAFFVVQHYIRQYYGIDPRIWFFVVFGLSMVGLFIIFIAFYSEIKNMDEYFKTHSFWDFITENVIPTIHKISTQIRPVMEKVVSSFWYQLLSAIILITVFAGTMYRVFFYDDFVARTTVYIIFLVMLAWVAINFTIEAMVIEKEKRKMKLILSGLWGLFFITYLLDFVCN